MVTVVAVIDQVAAAGLAAEEKQEWLAESLQAGGTTDKCEPGRASGLVARPSGDVTAGSDEDLLVAVVDEVTYWLDAEGEIPVSVAVPRVGDGGVDLVLSLADVSTVEIIGAVPKAAPLHDLRCAWESRSGLAAVAWSLLCGARTAAPAMGFDRCEVV